MSTAYGIIRTPKSTGQGGWLRQGTRHTREVERENRALICPVICPVGHFLGPWWRLFSGLTSLCQRCFLEGFVFVASHLYYYYYFSGLESNPIVRLSAFVGIPSISPFSLSSIASFASRNPFPPPVQPYRPSRRCSSFACRLRLGKALARDTSRSWVNNPITFGCKQS